MTEDLQLREEDKDTSESCIFTFPDRPVESLPPNHPGPTPPIEYPYDPVDDWPFIPPNERPVPGSDPHPNTPPPIEEFELQAAANFNASFLLTDFPDPIILSDALGINALSNGLFFHTGWSGSTNSEAFAQLQLEPNYPAAYPNPVTRGIVFYRFTKNSWTLIYALWYGTSFPPSIVWHEPVTALGGGPDLAMRNIHMDSILAGDLTHPQAGQIKSTSSIWFRNINQAFSIHLP